MSAPLLHEGKDLYKQKKYEEAISRFEQIIATEPENKDALLYIGLCYLKLEDVDHFATMISSIEKALQIDPNFKEAHVAKGNILLLGSALVEEPEEIMDLLKKANEACEAALQLDPNYKKAYILKQALNGRMNNYEEAFKASDKALELKPNSTQALLLRGSMLMILKQHGSDTRGEDPLAIFEKILSNNPNNEDALFAKGVLSMSNKELAKAVFEKLLASEKYAEKAQGMLKLLSQ